MWYDSNQRGLKLDPVYCEPPILKSPQTLKDTYKSFYAAKPATTTTTDSATSNESSAEKQN